MLKKLLFIMAVTSVSFSLPAQDHQGICIDQQGDTLKPYLDFTWNMSPIPFHQIHQMLKDSAYRLSPEAISKIIATLKCTKQFDIEHKNILAFIDFSLPSNQKRLWIFDLKNKTLLYHTHVSHGITSGALVSNQFSNKHNSKASSIGVFLTDQAYYGRHGLSLRLEGLERSFNDNAFNRYVVMHGSWYVSEAFIKRYGRPGRSWGCPAVPKDLSKPIIDTLKEDALFVAYFPSDTWFLNSKFLTCEAVVQDRSKDALLADNSNTRSDLVQREDILFADINKNDKREENEPIIVMTADDYEQKFESKAPLNRMLRRQINQTEYIALTNRELDELLKEHEKAQPDAKSPFDAVSFVIPVVKMLRGYYATEMKFVPLGKIKEVSSNKMTPESSEDAPGYTYLINFENKPAVMFKATGQFIRWLGL